MVYCGRLSDTSYSQVEKIKERSKIIGFGFAEEATQNFRVICFSLAKITHKTLPSVFLVYFET